MNKLKTPKKLPKFKTLAEEKKFWQTHDSTSFMNWKEAKGAVFPHLKPSTKTISLRLPEILLNQIKRLANKEDVPYQSLIKIILAQGVRDANSKQ